MSSTFQSAITGNLEWTSAAGTPASFAAVATTALGQVVHLGCTDGGCTEVSLNASAVTTSSRAAIGRDPADGTELVGYFEHSPSALDDLESLTCIGPLCRTDAGAWMPAQLDSHNDASAPPSIALSAGVAAIAYLDVSDAGAYGYMDVAECSEPYASCSGSIKWPLDDPSVFQPGGYTTVAIALGHEGALLVRHVATDRTYFECSNAGFTPCDGASWKELGPPDETLVDFVKAIRAVADYNGLPHLAGFDAAGDVSYGACIAEPCTSPASWRIEKVAAAGAPGAGANPKLALALDAAGTPLIAFADPATDGLKVVRKEGGAWAVHPLVTCSDARPLLGRIPSMVVDDAGSGRIAYQPPGGGFAASGFSF